MQQNQQEKCRVNHSIGLYLVILITSVLLYLTIVFCIFVGHNLNHFYKNKVEHRGQTTIVAVMPREQSSTKVLDYFEHSSETTNINTKDILYYEGANVLVNTLDETYDVMMQVWDDAKAYDDCGAINHTEVIRQEGKVNTTEAFKPKEATENGFYVMLPYIYQSGYHVSKGDCVTVVFSGQAYRFVVGGFFEDPLFSKPADLGTIKVYVSPKAFKTLEETNEMVEGISIEVETKQVENTTEIAKACVASLEDELFIGGLDLNIYTAKQLAEDMTLYIKYTKIISYTLGGLFFVITLIIVLLLVKVLKRKLKLNQITIAHKGIWLFIHVLITSVIGGVIQFVGMKKLICYLMEGIGYAASYEQKIWWYVIGIVVYVFIEVIAIKIGLMLADGTPRHYIQYKPRQKNSKVTGIQIIRSFLKQSIGVFLIACIITTVCRMVSYFYQNTMVEKNLFYQMNSEDAIEVFQVSNEMQVTDEMSQFDTLILKAKPLIYFATISIFALSILIVISMLYYVINQRVALLRSDGGQRVLYREQTIPVLVSLLVVLLVACAVAFVVSQCCILPVLTYLEHSYSISFPEISSNVWYDMVAFFLMLLITSTIAVCEVR